MISMGKLDNQEYHVIFGDDECKIVKENLVVARGWKKGTLYVVKLPLDEANTLISRGDL